MIREATLVDILRVAAALPEDEQAQIRAVAGRFDPEDAAARMYAQAGARFAICTPDTGEVVAVGGWSPVRESVLQSWMLVSRVGWERHKMLVTRDARKVTAALFAGPVRRLQTLCLASRSAACEWYRTLKLEPECVMRAFGVNGEDFAVFSRVREAG